MCAGRPNWLHAAPWCPKYDTKNSTQPTIYERLGDETYAQNVLELRQWKAVRALEVCQVRLVYTTQVCVCTAEGQQKHGASLDSAVQ